MSKRTIRTGLAVLCAAGAAASGMFLAAGPANAKAAADCQVTGMTPDHKIALGPNGKEMTFQIDTTCGADAKIDWYYIAQYPPNVPNDATFPLYQFANYNPGQSHFAVNAEGTFTLSSGPSAGDLLAGQPISTSLTAFVDTGDPGHQNEPYLDGYASTLTLLRATRVTGFTADKTTVNSGDYVTFTGTVQRADWETKSWRTFFSHGAHMQFRADGATKWTTYAGDFGAASPTVSGDYRIHYDGDDWSGASSSKPIHITVN
jgi:hypothetical protein